jgi:pimeloyl-ACP methyl ester carboxylesterase
MIPRVASAKLTSMTRTAGSKRHTDRQEPMSRPLVRSLLTLVGAAVVATALIASCSPKESQGEPSSSPSVTAPQAPPPNGVKPTIVLVHGAWADASSWDGEVDALQKQGYDVRAIANPLENLTTDAEYVSAFLKTVDGPVVLVGHSYGGSVITNAAEGNPNVKALVYVDAAAPDVGETNGSLSGSDSVLRQKPETELFDKIPYPGAPEGAVDLYLKKDVFLHDFGNDLPTDEATRLWATQRTASTAAFETPSKYAAWRTIPSWYFISSGDQIITPTSEKAMAERAKSKVTVFDGGSHLTLVSHPDTVTAVIDQAIESVH